MYGWNETGPHGIRSPLGREPSDGPMLDAADVHIHSTPEPRRSDRASATGVFDEPSVDGGAVSGQGRSRAN